MLSLYSAMSLLRVSVGMYGNIICVPAMVGACLIATASTSLLAATPLSGSFVTVLKNPLINESSGICASRRNPGIYYTHNECSADKGLVRFVAFNEKGDDRGTFSLAIKVWYVNHVKYRNIGYEPDIEDMAAATINGKHYILLANTGNNGHDAASRVYLLEEPELPAINPATNSPYPGTLPALDSHYLNLVYPSAGIPNVESVALSSSGEIFVATKEFPSRIYRTQITWTNGIPSIPKLTQMGSISFFCDPDDSYANGKTSPTGMDISPDGRTLLFLYNWPFKGNGVEYTLPADKNWTDANVLNACTITKYGKLSTTFPQPEAICYSADGQYIFTSSEGQQSYAGYRGMPLWKATRKIITDITPPTAPGNLLASALSPTSVQLTWDAASDSDNVAVKTYDIYRDGNKVGSSSVLNFIDTGLVHSTNYVYTVKAIDNAGNASELSAAANVTTQTPDGEPPSIPVVAASTLSSSAITVSWPAATDNVSVVSYTIYRNGNAIATQADLSLTDAGLNDGTTYVYTVLATDAAGNTSPLSAPATASTQTLPIPVVSATAASSTTASVTWTSTSSSNVTSFLVFRNGTQVGSVNATPFADTGLNASTTYAYTVAAKDIANNQSELSTVATITTATAPPATYFVRESFEYAAGSLANANGGIGWAGPWAVTATYASYYVINNAGLAAYPGLVAAGRSVTLPAGGNGSLSGTAVRTLAKPIIDDGGTYWIAFQLKSPTYRTAETLTLIGATPALLSLPTGSGMSYSFFGSAAYTSADVNAHVFLVKIQMSGDANPETASLYFDPTLANAPSTWTAQRTASVTLAAGGITGFQAYNPRSGSAGYNIQMDEFRIATTWQQAVGQAAPVTVPSGIASVPMERQVRGSWAR